MKTLYVRILNAFILIIVLTIVLSTLVEFISVRKELPRLLTEVRTKNIAHSLGASYTQGEGWGNLTDTIKWLEEENIKDRNIPSIRIIVRDKEGKTLFNSFSQLSLKSDAPLIEGGSIPVLNFKTGETVGSVTAYIDKNYLKKETLDYIVSIVTPRLLGGGMTVLLALIAAAILSGGIARPITALTRAAEELSLKERTEPLPVASRDELGRMSESFNRMIHSLENQRELRKRLISDVSHEILTPLNHIRLEARGLLDGISTTTDGAAQIIAKVDYLKNVIADLDWLAETDSGEYKLKLEKTNLWKLILSEVAAWGLKTEEEGKTIILKKSSEDLPPFNLDPIRIRQALGNIIENALKYSSQNSPIEVSCFMESDTAVISVTNQGIGIGENDKPNIFERFYRADTARTPGKSGRGLGLAIVKQIIELHGGRVWFNSEPGGETIFSFSLPR